MKERLASAAVRLAACLPIGMLQRVGWALGHLFVVWPNKQRRNALINIRICHPSLTPKEQLGLRDRTLREFGSTYLEIAYLWRRPVDEVLAQVTEVRGGELFARAFILIEKEVDLEIFEFVAQFQVGTRGRALRFERGEPVGKLL